MTTVTVRTTTDVSRLSLPKHGTSYHVETETGEGCDVHRSASNGAVHVVDDAGDVHGPFPSDPATLARWRCAVDACTVRYGQGYGHDGY